LYVVLGVGGVSFQAYHIYRFIVLLAAGLYVLAKTLGACIENPV